MKIKIPEAFKELKEEGKYRYKIYYGGRGGGKTQNFGITLLLKLMQKKLRWLCSREIQKSIKDSVHKNLVDLINEYQVKFGGIWNYWNITQTSISYPNGSEFIFCGLSGNAQQIKSLANIDGAWIEEAQTISYSSLNILIPTIRNEGSEIWFSFNRLTENDPVYEYFCVNPDERTYIRQVNYDENPYFPSVLEEERRRALKNLATEDYEHIWLGSPKNFLNESYYGQYIRKAEAQQRICRGVYDESLKVHTVWDLGVSDATAIWLFQLYGAEIRLINYYENSGEGIKFYLDILDDLREENKYKYGDHFAPHDITVREFSSGKSRLEIAHTLGLDFNILRADNINEGIQLVRTNFHRCYFDADNTKQGLKCLKNYRKLYDEKRQCYQEKPYHDWTSHGADAFRYLMQAVTFISPLSGGYKTDSEFDDDFERECHIYKNEYNEITGY
jgi:phage terminase large subunit